MFIEKLRKELLPFIGYDVASGELFFREGADEKIMKLVNAYLVVR